MVADIWANRFSQDLQIIDMELALALIGAAISILMLIAQCVVIVVESPWTGFAVLGLAIALVVVFRIYLRTTRRLRLLDIEMKAPVLSLLIESIDGLATVRALGWSEWYSHRGLRVLGEAQKPFHLLLTAQITLNLWLDLLVAILAVVVIGIAIGTGSSSGGSLGLALLNIVGVGQSVRIVVHFYTSLEITLGAVARIRDFTLKTASENTGREEPSPGWPRNGSIKFQNMAISHSWVLTAARLLHHSNANSHARSSLPPIIEGFELNIEPGSKVAICGRTGRYVHCTQPNPQGRHKLILPSKQRQDYASEFTPPARQRLGRLHPNRRCRHRNAPPKRHPVTPCRSSSRNLDTFCKHWAICENLRRSERGKRHPWVERGRSLANH